MADAINRANIGTAMPYFAVLYLGLAVFGLGLPYFLWRVRRYQHGNYNYGNQRTQLSVDIGVLYSVFIKFVGIGLLSGLAVIIVVFAVGFAYTMSGGQTTAGILAIGIFGGFSAILVINILQKSYLQVRLQNLFWSKTGNEVLNFQSALQLAPYLWLQCKNYVLIFLTLGLYWPFAVVNTRRAQLQAVELQTRVDLTRISNDARREDASAAGDMAADFFGFDVGL
jgi:uncharacterized membrane protein YjgN (DUF898 family)